MYSVLRRHLFKFPGPPFQAAAIRNRSPLILLSAKQDFDVFLPQLDRLISGVKKLAPGVWLWR